MVTRQLEANRSFKGLKYTEKKAALWAAFDIGLEIEKLIRRRLVRVSAAFVYFATFCLRATGLGLDSSAFCFSSSKNLAARTTRSRA